MTDWTGCMETMHRGYRIRVKTDLAKGHLYLVHREIAPTRDDLPIIHPDWQQDLQTWDEGNQSAIETGMTDEAKRRIDGLLGRIS